MQMSSTAKGIFFALTCLVLLGIMPIISNLRPAAISALPFAFALSFWEFFFSVPTLLVELRGRNKGVFSGAMPRAEIKRISIVTMGTGALYGVSTYLYVLGVEKAGASNAAIAMQAMPLFAILLEAIFLKRRKSRAEMVLTLIMLAALYYLGTSGTLQLAGLSLWILVALGVPALWSIAHMFVKAELTRTPITPTQVTSFRVGMSTLVLAVILIAVEPTQFVPLAVEALINPFSILMGLIYFTELVLWFTSLRHIDLSFASSVTTPWPVLTMVLAVFMLGDSIEPYQVGASLVVIACIYGLAAAGIRKARLATA